VREQTDILKGSADAGGSYFIGLQAEQGTLLKMNFALVRPVKARQSIKQRRFSCAIGTDQ
jgi:hypothetical protein